MKLSKSLLQAVALGLAIGGAATSCTTLLEEVEEITIDQCEKPTDLEKVTSTITTVIPHSADNCPACGMG